MRKELRMKILNAIYIVLVAVLITGCVMVPLTEKPKPEAPFQYPNKIAEAQALVEQQNPHKAMTVLDGVAEADRDANYEYTLAGVHSQVGNNDQAIQHYQKALEMQPDFHKAYTALGNIYQNNLLEINKEIEQIREKKDQAFDSGSDNLADLFEQLKQAQEKEATLFLSQGKSYLLYKSEERNIQEFPSIDSHLRDTQDILSKDTETMSEEIQSVRLKVNKKYIRTLYEKGLRLSKENVRQAIQVLKEVDDQLDKFYAESNPITKVSYLKIDQEIKDLAVENAIVLVDLYQEFLKILIKNRNQFASLGEEEEVETQNQEIEETLENWIQVRVTALWRKNEGSRENAEEHPEMIPVYKLFIEYIPDSTKTGEYHYRLARCFMKQNNYEKANFHARKAQDLVGSFKVTELLEELDKVQR